MKWLILSISFVVASFQLIAGESETPFEKSKRAYLEKRYDDAITILKSELRTDDQNPSLYFNLGLAYKAEKDYPRAIWAFEKTLKLQPNDSESIQLINVCYEAMDTPTTWQSEVGTLNRSLFSLGSDFWSLIAISLSVLTAFFIVRIRKTTGIGKKKVRLVMAVTFGIFMLFSVYVAASAYTFEHEHDYAIVIKKDLPAFDDANPNATDTSSVNLQPGIKVEILEWDTKSNCAILAPNGQKVYIRNGDGIARI